ncbi:MAG: ABC transporter substrate-binding protein [Candidatus Krumholzibacteria bacterium]|nr:ABC transporter substrate-binding protein [Candidatus Krumholzibacteria bacterium]
MSVATSPDRVDLIAFPGAPNLPIFVAMQERFFERAGVDVDLETTPSSSYQIANLVAGKYQIGATAFDNVVAYQEGQGAVELDASPDLFAFMGATQIELSLVVAPDIEGYDDLRGRSLALDALSTGFAFVLYHMLEHAGLGAGDYTLAAVGATPQRWEAVKAGEHAGTLTIEPFTSLAVANGFRILDTSRTALDHYQGGVFAASRAWAAENAGALAGFIRGYLRGLAWTLDPANRESATETLLRRMPAIKPQLAGAVMRKLLNPATGLTPMGRVDDAGVAAVLDLRSRYGSPARPLRDPGRYLDLSYYDQALPLDSG